MRKYTVNKDNDEKIPSKESIAKYKDFSRIFHEYDRLTKRPKQPIYKDKRAYLALLLILLVVYLVSQADNDESTKSLDNQSSTEQVETSSETRP